MQEIADKMSEAAAQLSIYAADQKIQNMTEGTQLHKIAMVFKGWEMVRCEER